MRVLRWVVPVVAVVTVVTLAAVAVLAWVGVPRLGIRPTGVIKAGDPLVASVPGFKNVIYFVKAGRLEPVVRQGTVGRPGLALDQLIEGPGAQERARGLSSALPRDVVVEYIDNASVGIEAGTKKLDEQRWPRLARAQLACTVASIAPEMVVEMIFSADGSSRQLRCTSYDDLRN